MNITVSRLADFKLNDRVDHRTAGPGTVITINDEMITVLFDTKIYKKPVRGVYDHRWFELHPNSLTVIRARAQELEQK